MTHTASSQNFAAPARPSRFKGIKFIFRIAMLALPIGFFALTRSNPELHLTMVSKVSEYMQPYLGGGEGAESTTMAQRFKDKIKVNRFGSSNQGGAFGGGGGNARANAQSQADDLGRSLSNFKVGG